MRIAMDGAETTCLNRLQQSDDFKWFMDRLAHIAAEKVGQGLTADGSERYRLDGDVRTLLAIHEEITGSRDALTAMFSSGNGQTARIPMKARA